MGQKDFLVQIISDVSYLDCNFLILGKNAVNTANAVTEALEYWRKQKIAISNIVEDEEACIKAKFASVKTINVLEITPI